MIRFLTAIGFALSAVSGLAETSQPYAGQQNREIATLSAQDIEDLLAGRGWGLAKAAELNGYPGPAHILELADELALSNSQIVRVQAIFDAMNARARVLGAAYVDAETELNRAFTERNLTDDKLLRLTENSATLLAKLRATHLAAHLEVAPVLNRHQSMSYATLRGYGSDHSGHADH